MSFSSYRDHYALYDERQEMNTYESSPPQLRAC